MSHSIETHKRAYEEIVTTSHAAQAHSLVQRLSSKDRKQNLLEESPRPKKMFWTGPQIAELENFFEKELRELSHATTDRCKRFLQAYPIEGQIPKHVQDIVRSLIDKKNYHNYSFLFISLYHDYICSFMYHLPSLSSLSLVLGEVGAIDNIVRKDQRF